MATLNRQLGRDRGIALMEMALILPLLILLTFGIIEYGWVFLKLGEVSNAARHGARVGIRPGSTQQNVTDAVDQLMESAGLGASGYQVTVEPGDVGGMNPGEVLSVSISVPYSNIALTGVPLIPIPENVHASAKMAKEGPE